jgi:hypothetical protein
MKKFFSFVSAILVAGTMCAQTITIDGDNADWAEVPMLTEPGVGPVVKMLVPQEGVTLADSIAYAVMVEGTHELMLAGYPVIYTDADMSTETGGAAWFCPSFGKDYEMGNFDGLSVCANNETESVREMGIKKSSFNSIPFTGSVATVVSYNWGELLIPAATKYDWKEFYRPFIVEPTTYTYTNLVGTHNADDVYTTHPALTMAESLNMGVTGASFDTAFWAAWTVNLVEPTVYNVTVNFVSTNTANADFYLVEPATNKIVATFVGEEPWAPEGVTEYGTWDLSAVPAGKYILKMKNHVPWSAVVFNSVTFTAEGNQTTGIENTLVDTTSKKVIENGQIYIIRGNERYNVLGTSVR